jgi:PTH1 family peptidyl-tRNA hydrolase
VFKKRKRFPELPGAKAGDVAALVVGLGNPGSEYVGTRHNAGFMAADKVLKSSNVLNRAQWEEGELALAERGHQRFLVLKPGTFMNVSGRAVAPVLRHYRLGADRMIVLHDDIDVPTGEARAKSGGGTAGHRGLASIVDAVGDQDFHRVRMGIGRPPAGVDPADYVLSRFREDERELARAMASDAATRALGFVREVAGAGE